jgi:hypothetical protein
MSLAALDKAAERIKLATPTMRKGSFDGKKPLGRACTRTR